MKQTKMFLGLFLLASLFTFSACGGGDDDGAAPDATPGADGGTPDATPLCAEATQHQDFTWIQANILQRSCANFSSCHGPTGTREHLLLTADAAYTQLVNVASEQIPGKMRVTPNDCQNSYLYDKLTNMNIKSGTQYMPASSPMLCQEKIDAVCRWIMAGAPNN